MRSIFRIAIAAVAGASALMLSGCVVAPAYPGYYGGGGGGYYAPAPVVVQPSIGLGFYGGGGWGGGGGRYWRR